MGGTDLSIVSFLLAAPGPGLVAAGLGRGLGRLSRAWQEVLRWTYTCVCVCVCMCVCVLGRVGVGDDLP